MREEEGGVLVTDGWMDGRTLNNKTAKQEFAITFCLKTLHLDTEVFASQVNGQPASINL